MLRAAAETRLRCVDHPHRRATRQCARCKSGYCDECAARLGEGAVCERCQLELDEKERIEHPPVQERVRRFGMSLRNALILCAILAVLAVPLSFMVRDMVETPLTCEEFARFRYAAGGTFETPEGVNSLSTVLGAKMISGVGANPNRLIDECVNPGYGGWRSEDAAFPQEFLFETANPTRIEKLLFTQQPGEPPETMVREVEVLVSTQSPDGPYAPVGRYTLAQTEEPQRFVVANPPPAQWVKLRVLSNHGGPYASLGEFNTYLLPRTGFAAEGATPAARP